MLKPNHTEVRTGAIGGSPKEKMRKQQQKGRSTFNTRYSLEIAQLITDSDFESLNLVRYLSCAPATSRVETHDANFKAHCYEHQHGIGAPQEDSITPPKTKVANFILPTSKMRNHLIDIIGEDTIQPALVTYCAGDIVSCTSWASDHIQQHGLAGTSKGWHPQIDMSL